MIILGAEITDDIIAKAGKRLKNAAGNALVEAVKQYHREIFTKHFTPGNSARYRMQKRTTLYTQLIKKKAGSGQGKFVDLLLKGASQRRMMAFATVRKTDGGNTAVLRMETPRYFTNPFIGTFTDAKSGKQKQITQQPDKVAEVVQLNPDDRQRLAAMIMKQLTDKFKNSRPSRSRKKL